MGNGYSGIKGRRLAENHINKASFKHVINPSDTLKPNQFYNAGLISKLHY